MVAAGNYIMLTIVVVNQIKVKALKLYIIDIPIKHINSFKGLVIVIHRNNANLK